MRFVNPNGLDAPGAPTVTTALDMARLGAYGARMPDLVRLTSTREDRSIRNGKGGKLWLVNTNRLLGVVPGVNGLKTGFTSAAGFCLTASAQRAGLRLVAVVMGDVSSKTRFTDTTALLSWGFTHYRAAYGARAGEAVAYVAVRGGAARRVALVPERDAVFTVPRPAARRRPSPDASSCPRRLPRRCARVAPSAASTVSLAGESRQVTLVTADDVARIGPFDILRRLVGVERPPAGRGSGGPASHRRPAGQRPVLGARQGNMSRIVSHDHARPEPPAARKPRPEGEPWAQGGGVRVCASTWRLVARRRGRRSSSDPRGSSTS